VSIILGDDGTGTTTTTSSTSVLGGIKAMQIAGAALAAYSVFGRMPRKLRHFRLPLMAVGLYYSGLPQALANKVGPMLPAPFNVYAQNPMISTAVLTLGANMVFSKNTYRRVRGGYRRTRQFATSYRGMRRLGFSRGRSLRASGRYSYRR